jgi:hypothetical protein
MPEENTQSLVAVVSQWQVEKRKIAELRDQEEKAADLEEKARFRGERQSCEIKDHALEERNLAMRVSVNTSSSSHQHRTERCLLYV